MRSTRRISTAPEALRLNSVSAARSSRSMTCASPASRKASFTASLTLHRASSSIRRSSRVRSFFTCSPLLTPGDFWGRSFPFACIFFQFFLCSFAFLHR